MMLWILIAFYAVCVVLTFRCVLRFRFKAYSINTWGQLTIHLVDVLVWAFLWPLYNIFLAQYYLSRRKIENPDRVRRVLAGESRRERAERRRRELDALEADNHRRARELGIEDANGNGTIGFESQADRELRELAALETMEGSTDDA